MNALPLIDRQHRRVLRDHDFAWLEGERRRSDAYLGAHERPAGFSLLGEDKRSPRIT